MNRVYDGSALDVLDVDLAPGNYLVTLLSDWTLNVDTGDGFAPVDAVLQSPNPQTVEIVAGSTIDVVFQFGVGEDKIAFGEGRARIRIDLDDCVPTPEICDGADNDCDGAVDEIAACIPEVCDNAVDDDADGFTDCDDAECAELPACTVPAVGTTGSEGVFAGADWQVCRADEASAWVSAGDGGGTYDADAVCQALGYDGADAFGGNCNEVCGYCGAPGQETYDGAGAGWPDAFALTVNWRCVRGFVPPVVGFSSDEGVADGAGWEVCRADADSVWISGQSGGGTYDATTICASLGYASVGEFGGNCNTVCGYCGNAGQETYDGAGAGWPDAFRSTVTWSCTNP